MTEKRPKKGWEFFRWALRFVKLSRQSKEFLYRLYPAEASVDRLTQEGVARFHFRLAPEKSFPLPYFFKLTVRGRFRNIRVANARVTCESDLDSLSDTILPLKVESSHKMVALFKLDVLMKGLALELEGVSAELESVTMRRVLPHEVALRLLLSQVKARFRDPKALMGWLHVSLWHLKKSGMLGLREWLRIEAMKDCFYFINEYSSWIETYDKLSSEDRSLIRDRMKNLAYQPLISILMPVYNTDEVWLRHALDSVVNQLYPHWELCVADDKSPSAHVRSVLEEYRARDPRIKVTYRTENGHISAATNTCLSMAVGEFVALFDHDDELAEHALYMVVEELNRFPKTDLIYSDEDKIDALNRRFSPHFKPDWNSDLMLSFNLVTHLAVFRSELLRSIGGFRKGF